LGLHNLRERFLHFTRKHDVLDVRRNEAQILLSCRGSLNRLSKESDAVTPNKRANRKVTHCREAKIVVNRI
jgi:hypothetical protein